MPYKEVLIAVTCIVFAKVFDVDGCEDKVSLLCARHKRQGHCEDSRWARMLKNTCQKTCSFCSGKKVCLDANQALCRQRKRRGECDQPTFYTLNMCKKTCDFCSGRIKIKSPKKKFICEDKLKDCKRIGEMGLCEKLGKLKLRCPLSCNICAGPEKME